MHAPLTIVAHAYYRRTSAHHLFFESRAMPGVGVLIPCDAQGAAMTPEMAARVAELSAGGRHHPPRVEAVPARSVVPAFGMCACGATVLLTDPGDNQCAGCGAWYDGAGAPVAVAYSLAPRRIADEPAPTAEDAIA